jgi:hypothetical protein
VDPDIQKWVDFQVGHTTAMEQVKGTEINFKLLLQIMLQISQEFLITSQACLITSQEF